MLKESPSDPMVDLRRKSIGLTREPSPQLKIKEIVDPAGHSVQPESWKVSSSLRPENYPTSQNNNYWTAQLGLIWTSDAMVVFQQELLDMLREMVLQPKMLTHMYYFKANFRLPFKEHAPSREEPTKFPPKLHWLLMKKVSLQPSMLNQYQSELMPPTGNIMIQRQKNTSQIVKPHWTTLSWPSDTMNTHTRLRTHGELLGEMMDSSIWLEETLAVFGILTLSSSVD